MIQLFLKTAIHINSDNIRRQAHVLYIYIHNIELVFYSMLSIVVKYDNSSNLYSSVYCGLKNSEKEMAEKREQGAEIGRLCYQNVECRFTSTFNVEAGY